MKKPWLYSLAFLATVNLSCTQRLFRYTVTFQESTFYSVNETDTFTRQATISRANVAAAFKLPEGARVTELKIESLSIRVEVANNNQATAIKATGKMGNDFLFQDFLVPLVEVFGYGVNNLIASGIGKLKTEIENFVKGLGTSPNIPITLSGESVPIGESMVLTIFLDIKATVKYERCEEVPIFLNAGEEKCSNGLGPVL